MSAVTSARLIFTDLAKNNNKFWNADVVGASVVAHWGRVGENGERQTKVFGDEHSAQKYFESTLRSKVRKGYTHQQTIADGVVKRSVSYVAKVEIQHGNDKETAQLIDFLVQRNIHKIESTTSIRLDVAGKLTTPLGQVTLEGLDAAQVFLDNMATGQAFDDSANQYLRIVPRAIGRRKIDARDLFGNPVQLEAEQAMVDSLRAVVKDLDQQADTAAPRVFQTKLSLLNASAKDFSRINAFYMQNLNRMHASSSMRLHRVWEMKIDSMEANFNHSVGNVQELWHGTRDANLLSILKNGFIIASRNSTIQIAGRMFGDGVYFSDQSTKSLNYATDSAPGQRGTNRSIRKFMLLNKVAMGREHIPRGRNFNGKLPTGYNSCFAKAGVSGVINNEMVVYDTSQINPSYLCEFQ